MLGFDHDAGQRFGAGIAEDDAAILAEGGLGFGEGARNFGKRIETRLGFHFYVDDKLRVVLEAANQGFEGTVHGDQGSDFNGGKQTIASGTIVEKNNVAGLFAAEVVTAAQHFFEDVAIADIGARERDIFGGEDALEAKVGHGSGDDAIAL